MCKSQANIILFGTVKLFKLTVNLSLWQNVWWKKMRGKSFNFQETIQIYDNDTLIC